MLDLRKYIPDSDIKTWVGPFPDKEIYLRIGKNQAEKFIQLTGAKKNSRILDLGCGCGRLAIHFIELLDGIGTYIGIDASRELLDWCSSKISPDWPNFEFHRVNIYNGAYNDKGSMQPREFKIPFGDSSFDIIYAVSLFTHMRFDDMVYYLREIYRVLKKDGKFLSTYLLLNDGSLQAISKKESHFNLIYQVGEHSRTFSEKCPEEGIGHDEHELMRTYDEIGLRASLIEYGSWPRKYTEDLHDVVIATK